LAPIINFFRANNTSRLGPGTNTSQTTPGAGLTCTISANPLVLIPPQNGSQLTWSCERAINGCLISDDNPRLPDIGAVPSSGNREVSAIDADTKFTLNCPGASPVSVIIKLFGSYIKEVIPQ
jgi:hypothetical protein